MLRITLLHLFKGPDWHVKFDSDKELAAKTRVKFFDMLATEKNSI